MSRFPVPRLVVSRCLEFEEVRYNGAVIPDKAVQRLQGFVDFIPVCPEVEIGLGVPREVIRIVDGGEDDEKLIQPKTGEELTGPMKEFSKAFIGSLSDVDGFLLKNRSPTCGVQDVKVYQSEKNSQVVRKTTGFFAKEVLNQFGGLAIEEEGRMKNFTLRHHFLTKLFTLADFRRINKEKSLKSLQAFHSKNKYLFMAYHPGTLKLMGRTLANHDHLPIDAVLAHYEEHLYQLLSKPAKPSAHVNVCQHIAGYFKNELNKEEKRNFQSLVRQYSEEKVPLSAVISVLRSWVARFDSQYLQQQTYFEPYPEELVEISDSGKGRAYS
ncbi:DUF523 and DUF1722 domain-containing protein [Halobacillus yeomjeoni]|uniref:YbgA family protein n=1 Tax=Halobacillus yeomjeoni TaxID=311194 RepID=UPI001CD3F089|nr:DUF523 and DUF1722 domain-containing protein [Halobacillus yeomjeoni]MCA0985408.1 DUF523 and DUF1722 domain-containing protein [Halobacillus yeomjeoni]